MTLRGSLWAVHALLSGGAAYFGAAGLTSVAGVAVSRALPPLVAAGAKDAPLQGAAPRARDAEPILARNPFDSVTGSLLKKAGDTAVAAGEGLHFGVPPCAKLRVVVIAVAEEPEASLAAFEVEGDRPVLRRAGAEIGADTVEVIDVDRVLVRQNGKICQTALFAPPAPPPEKAHASATPKIDVAGDGLDPSLSRGIERLGPGSYRIDRTVVDRLLDDQAEIMKGGMIRPEKEGDRTVGVRLFGVRPDRLFGVLGLQDGDVMRSLNGYDFSSPERMLEAYARLRGASSLTLDFSRGGQTVQHTYSIQ